MPEMLHIKNMVCARCVAAVKGVLEDLSIPYERVNLGEVLLKDALSSEQSQDFERQLTDLGFELIRDHRSQLIEQIKTLVVEQIHHRDRPEVKQSWSELITDHIPYEYKYLSRLFSSVEGLSLEQYIIRQKIERAKELLVYDQLTLSEIAYALGYSSVAHLSSQFKKVTGMAPSAFKEIGAARRKSLDQV